MAGTISRFYGALLLFCLVMEGYSATPLLVTLSSFKALYGQNVATVTWATELEANHAGYRLYRSNSENGPFENLTDQLITVAENGESSKKQYKFNDNSVPTGAVFYQLEDMALNGVSTFHGPIQLQVASQVKDKQTGPIGYELLQNYPNPFNPTTTVRYDLAAAEYVLLRVFDLTGQLVATLMDGRLPAGTHQAQWHGLDDMGQNVPTGVYVLVLDAGEISKTRSMTLIR